MRILRTMSFAGISVAILALSACYSELDWREVTSVQGRYRITMPAKPQEEIRTLKHATGSVKMTMTAARAADWMFGVSYADFPAGVDIQKQRDEQRDAVLRNISGRIIKQSQGRPGTSALIAEGRRGDIKLDLRARFIVDGQRLYQIAAIGTKGSVPDTEVDTFLDSFKLQNLAPPAVVD